MSISIETIISQMKEYIPDLKEDKIREAYKLAEESHTGQFRKSGEEYIIHPLHVAEILTPMQMDEATIICALLHDVVEDVEAISIEMIEEKFGSEVGYIVNGLTKLKKISSIHRNNLQVENLMKMFLTTSKDIRVLLIKLADRLHNMRTLKYMPRDRQLSIAKETLEIYAPVAHRLGAFQIKWELEDLSFKYLEPERYNNLVDQISKKRIEREADVETIIGKIKNKLEELKIEADVTGRTKHFYSIYNKMVKKNQELDEIFDLTAVRIIVSTIQDCYSALGVIHMIFTPIPNRFKDYIAMPKPNMYQSIHTTVLGPNTDPFEVQIRTIEMHKTAEYGIAAHWKYKEGGKFSYKEFQKESSFIEQIREIQSDSAGSATDFIDSLKADLFTDRIYVFTPKGDVIELKNGSTPLDFAFRVHSDVGLHYAGAKVNNHIVPISYKLQTGDILEILTNRNAKPSLDWLKMVETKHAQNKIRNWFKNQNREMKIEKGKENFDRECKKESFDSIHLDSKYLEKLYKSYGMHSMEDLYAAIGDGAFQVRHILRKLRDIVNAQLGDANTDKMLVKPWEGYGKGTHGIRVQGFDNVDIHISKCCNPLPDDEVSGYINRGKGISVHRTDCPNFLYLKRKEPYRIVNVIWEKKEVKNLSANLEITTTDKKGITPFIINKFHELNADVLEINSKVANSLVTMKVKIGINSSNHLEDIFFALNKEPDIIEINRIILKGKIKNESSITEIKK
jgi:GTP diphosphokinase / guanosine-3',5'-bis(diphosphate) 3'-diphosphatase